MNATIKSAVAEAAAALANADVQEPRLDATRLLMHVLARDRAYLLAHSDYEISPNDLACYRSLIEQRAAGLPLQHLTRQQEFFKSDF